MTSDEHWTKICNRNGSLTRIKGKQGTRNKKGIQRSTRQEEDEDDEDKEEGRVEDVDVLDG